MSRRERRLQEEREAKEQKKLAKLARKENRKRKKNIEYELVIENTDCENKEQTVEIAKYRKEEKTPNIVWKIAKGFLKALLVIILALILILVLNPKFSLSSSYVFLEGITLNSISLENIIWNITLLIKNQFQFLSS